jgi:hypothetical protein
MNIWTAFFLVVSIVILAAPLLLSGGVLDRNSTDGARSRSGGVDGSVAGSGLPDDELEMDLASGRLARDDYEVMSGRKPAGRGEDHGNIP